jgi:hypothetical protein
MLRRVTVCSLGKASSAALRIFSMLPVFLVTPALADTVTFGFTALYSQPTLQGDTSNLPACCTGAVSGQTLSGNFSLNPNGTVDVAGGVPEGFWFPITISLNLPFGLVSSPYAAAQITGPGPFSLQTTANVEIGTTNFPLTPSSQGRMISYGLGITLVDPTGTAFNPNSSKFPSSFNLAGLSSAYVWFDVFNEIQTASDGPLVIGQETYNFQLTQIAQAPLPAALPLFAGGLGALGLLGWRRKRKTRTRSILPA